MYSTVSNVSSVQKAYKASPSLWKQWFTESNTCRPVIPGRTFADVVKQNAYSCNIGASKSVPLEATQLCGLKGVPLGPVKEKNVSGTVSPQVQHL